MSTQKLNIGLFGFGCVGQGLYHVLQNSKGFTANITKIAVKDKNKKRSLPSELFTFDKYEILNNSNINVVVELIDDADEAFQIVKSAMQSKKHVVTANKKMLATYLEELLKLKEENGVSLLYEASSCGSIPIIRTLEEYYDNELIHSIAGIFNGTTNYILTKTIAENLTYTQALQQAQEKGFAESNPASDVEGFDAKYKAIIIALHAFGIIAKPNEILNIGITTLAAEDIRYAAEKKYKIKLVPTIKRFETGEVSIFVTPKFIQQTNPLFYVDNEFNGVLVDGDFSGEQFLKGRGAGGNPTGAAVLSDISALSFGYQYEFKKLNQLNKNKLTSSVKFKAYLRYNSSLDLERLNIKTIYEQYISETYKYVVAEVSLETLLFEAEYIRSSNLFIALVSEQLCLDVKSGNEKLTALDFEIAISEAKETIQLLDVRTVEEYNGGHIKNSVLSNIKDTVTFESAVSVLDKNKAVYVYCLAGGRSSKAANYLVHKGFKYVYELEGGMNAWRKAGMPEEKTTLTQQLSIQSFETNIEKEGTHLICIQSKYCGPCVEMEPVIENIEKEFTGINVLRINGGVDREVMKHLKVDEIPTFIVFKNGSERCRITGLTNKESLVGTIADF